MIDRVRGRAAAAETPVGLVPTADALNLDGLDLTRGQVEKLLKVDRDEWAAEVPQIRTFFDRFGDRLPRELARCLDTLDHELTTTAV
jgi:phosphoenolpyruvate carboxykinase (GTP)